MIKVPNLDVECANSLLRPMIWHALLSLSSIVAPRGVLRLSRICEGTPTAASHLTRLTIGIVTAVLFCSPPLSTARGDDAFVLSGGVADRSEAAADRAEVLVKRDPATGSAAIEGSAAPDTGIEKGGRWIRFGPFTLPIHAIEYDGHARIQCAGNTDEPIFPGPFDHGTILESRIVLRAGVTVVSVPSESCSVVFKAGDASPAPTLKAAPAARIDADYFSFACDTAEFASTLALGTGLVISFGCRAAQFGYDQVMSSLWMPWPGFFSW